MERKLATIEKILDIQPIENADKICVAVIRGWKVVVKKDEFKPGDLCVYFETDSFIPIRSEFEFLRKSCYKIMADGSEGFRLRTQKLRNQISQGLCMPLSILPGYCYHEFNHLYSSDEAGAYRIIGEGMDVTKDLHIIKYEPPIPAQLSGKVRGPFPSFLHTTDEERIQNIGFVLTRYKDTDFYASEKLDGTSGTFYIRNGEFGVCSRGLDLYETDTNTYWKVARTHNLEMKMRSVEKNLSLQGEVIGEGIQSNKYGLKGQTVRFFNAYDIDAGKYYDFYDFVNLINTLGLETVPIVNSFMKLPTSIEEIIATADGMSILNPSQIREGIVYRPIHEIFDGDMPHGGRLSFKAKSNAFILKYDD